MPQLWLLRDIRFEGTELEAVQTRLAVAFDRSVDMDLAERLDTDYARRKVQVFVLVSAAPRFVAFVLLLLWSGSSFSCSVYLYLYGV